jgi:hypothetical protein
MYKLTTILTVILFAQVSLAYDDYDVDWKPDHPSDVHILRITVDKCTTEFKVLNKDFYSFTKNDDALQQLLDLAIKRAEKGCS